MNVFVKYSLLQGSEIVAASVKSSFCLEDSECRAGTSKKEWNIYYIFTYLKIFEFAKNSKDF